jgi:hypothetical protein
VDSKDAVATAKQALLKRLAELGVDETGNLIVASVRKSRPGLVGYYSHMSQFRGRARIVVDPQNIAEGLREMDDCAPSDVEVAREIFKTIAHEYGHIIAEAIRELPRMGGTFNVPDWKSTFDADEEEFAEDFARLMALQHCSFDFWDTFMPQYAAEFDRLFSEELPAEKDVSPETGMSGG